MHEALPQKDSLHRAIRMAVIGVVALLIFVAISVSALGSLEGVSEALGSLQWWAVVGSCVCALISLFFESFAIGLLAGCWRPKELMGMVRAYLAGSFVGNVTPWAIGGMPAWTWALTREGIGAAEAAAVVTGRSVAVVMCFAIASLVAAILAPGVTGLSRVISAAALIPAACIIGVFVIIRYPGALTTWADKVLRALDRHVRWRFVADAIDRAPSAIAQFSSSLHDLATYRFWAFIGSIAMIGISRTFQLLAIPMLLASFGVVLPLTQVLLDILLVWVLMSVSPTPSGEGVAQAALMLIFQGTAPREALAATAIAWRAFVYYTMLVVGGIYFVGLVAQRPSPKRKPHRSKSRP